MRRFRLLSLLLLASVSCGQNGAESPAPPSSEPPATVSGGRPPPIHVVIDGREVPLWQGSFCWDSGESSSCADFPGPQRSDLVDVGSPQAVELVFAVRTTDLRAYFTPLGDRSCRRDFEVEPVDLGGGHFRLDPVGPAGPYRVDVHGSAAQGEVPGSFLWKTPVTRPGPEPEARMSIVWEPHGRLEGQGFLFTVEDLPATPSEASAVVTVTAGNGETMTFDAGRPRFGCTEEGYLWFSERGTTLSDKVAELGPTPFTYEVELRLDGTTYQGTGTYPESVDSDPANDNPAPVLLEFDPPLPRWKAPR